MWSILGDIAEGAIEGLGSVFRSGGAEIGERILVNEAEEIAESTIINEAEGAVSSSFGQGQDFMGADINANPEYYADYMDVESPFSIRLKGNGPVGNVEDYTDMQAVLAMAIEHEEKALGSLSNIRYNLPPIESGENIGSVANVLEDEVKLPASISNEPIESIVQEPVPQEPVPQEPALDEPALDEPVAEEPVAEEPVAEEEPDRLDEEFDEDKVGDEQQFSDPQLGMVERISNWITGNDPILNDLYAQMEQDLAGNEPLTEEFLDLIDDSMTNLQFAHEEVQVINPAGRKQVEKGLAKMGKRALKPYLYAANKAGEGAGAVGEGAVAVAEEVGEKAAAGAAKARQVATAAEQKLGEVSAALEEFASATRQVGKNMVKISKIIVGGIIAYKALGFVAVIAKNVRTIAGTEGSEGEPSQKKQKVEA